MKKHSKVLFIVMFSCICTLYLTHSTCRCFKFPKQCSFSSLRKKNFFYILFPPPSLSLSPLILLISSLLQTDRFKKSLQGVKSVVIYDRILFIHKKKCFLSKILFFSIQERSNPKLKLSNIKLPTRTGAQYAQVIKV